MSGIRILFKQLLLLLTILIVTLPCFTISATERTVKVSAAQSKTVDQRLKATKSANKSQYMSSLLHEERLSSYKDVSEPGIMHELINSQKSMSQEIDHPIYRPANLDAQLKSSDFYINSASVWMDIDYDGDGYYSEFTLNFDADTDYNTATVYALLYLRYEGGPWELYYTTNDFNISGWSSYDDYQVRTQLTNGFPPGRYDLLIDLYDVYDNSLVVTLSSWDTYELADLYLEDNSYEDNFASDAAFSIFDASITLLSDNDNDGFYQSFSLLFDADVISGKSMVYAEIWVRDSTGEWRLDHSTEDFMIEGNSTLDTYILETVWESGYSRGYYDFRIELYDANNDDLLATSDALSDDLSNVPLEAATLDIQSSNTNTNTNTQTSISIESGGGGSMGTLLMAIILLIRRLAYTMLKL